MNVDKDAYIKTYGKKAYRELCKKQRVVVGFNIGTREITSKKVYSRKTKHKGKMD